MAGMELISLVISKNRACSVLFISNKIKQTCDFSMLPPGGGVIWLLLSDIDLH